MAVTAKKTSWNADKGKCIGDGKITNVAAITEVTATVLSSDTAKRGRDCSGVPDHLNCCVCLDVPLGRVEQCPHGHIMCASASTGNLSSGSSCLHKVRRHAAKQCTPGRCPMCRVELPPELSRCLVAEQTIASLPGTCTYCKIGGTRGEIAVHAEACTLGPKFVCCAADAGCDWTGPLAESRVHEKTCNLALQRAAWEGKLERVKMVYNAANVALGSFLEIQTLPEYQQAHLLHLASVHNMTGVMQGLVRSQGVKVGVPSMTNGETALCAAARCGNWDIVRVLLNTDVALDEGYSTAGISPLYLACQEGHMIIVRMLITAGAGINVCRVDNNETPLHIASRNGHADIVDLLINEGADVNVCSTEEDLSTHESPLFAAAQSGHASVINRLVKVPGVFFNKLRKTDGMNASSVALLYGHVEISHQLILAASWANMPGQHAITAEYDSDRESIESDDNFE